MTLPNWVCGTHSGCSTGAVGGAPYEATKRCTGLVKRKEEGGEGERGRRARRRRGMRGTVSSKRGPNTG
eukprot:6494883-Pyramimonas_sp.AAC.1